MKNVKMMLTFAFIMQTTLASAQTTLIDTQNQAIEHSQLIMPFSIDFENELQENIAATFKQIQLDITNDMKQNLKQLLSKEFN
jgi:hypothetical protein